MLEHYCSFGADFGFDSESTIFVMESSMFIAIIVQTRLIICPQQVNGLIGGAAAGAAVAARTRSWPQVIGMAGLVSVFCAAADYSRT
ncbi:hypothetical protein KIW84_064505 [Lathyrus oleraceus]|uniref:Uncharacterized protein n=1 Tax=Pisum sativum TaxID=3888 RepID=A0A9D4WCD9_PEA|nr:hypothetical protein KIW84_064505 [Pisum sativum]